LDEGCRPPGSAASSTTQCDDQQVDVREKYARNVRCIFVVLFFVISSGTITLGPLFDALLLNIGGDKGNILVGAVESTRGMVQLAVAYPIGVVSDRMSRIRLLQRNLPVWTIGWCLIVAGILAENVPVIFVGMALWAPCSQCWNSTAQVLVADYSPAGARTAALTNLASVRVISSSLGPLLQIVLLLITSQNHWRNSLLRWVTSAGCLLWPCVVFLTCRLQDLQSLEQRTSGSAFRVDAVDRRVFGVKLRWLLAGTLEFSSFVTAIGAGMTVKFFPLFFRVDYKFTPIEVCLVSFIYPVSISAMMQVCIRVSKRFGRLHTILVFHVIGTSCLWALCYVRSLILVIPLFLLRGSLMNAKGPIARAVVMDLVPAHTRGRWNSIQSILSFSWSGSALLGGFLADATDYRLTFMVTAVIYTVAGLILCPLLWLYPGDTRITADASSLQGPVQDVADLPDGRDSRTPSTALQRLGDQRADCLGADPAAAGGEARPSDQGDQRSALRNSLLRG